MPDHTIVDARDLSVLYSRCDRFSRVRRQSLALDRVSIAISRNGTLGLTGPSGSGKSTLARCLAGLQRPDQGEVKRLGPVQIVTQEPGESLNPRFTARQTMEEPLVIAKAVCFQSLVASIASEMGFSPADLRKKSRQFSGGERARLEIARAIAAMQGQQDGLLILDESLSAFDPQTCSDILACISRARVVRFFALLLISHDFELLKHIVPELVVMENGRITGRGSPAELQKQCVFAG